MQVAYISAFAALAGSATGGLTSLAASWLTQRTQVRTQQLAREISRREESYRDFIEEAANLYADALKHDDADASKLVRMYALVSRMRVLSSPLVVEKADRVLRMIIDTYLGPTQTFRDLAEAVKSGKAMDPLREFSEECREELRTFGLS